MASRRPGAPAPFLIVRAIPTRRTLQRYERRRESTKNSTRWPARTGSSGGWAVIWRTVIPGLPRIWPGTGGSTAGAVPSLPERSRTDTTTM